MFISLPKPLRQKSWLNAIPDTIDVAANGIDPAISAAASEMEGGK